jgi:hypothetical protein
VPSAEAVTADKEAESVTEPPAFRVEGEKPVDMTLMARATTGPSQLPVAGRLLASPVYTAWRLYSPGEDRVKLDDEGTKPLTTVTIEVSCGVPEQEPSE